MANRGNCAGFEGSVACVFTMMTFARDSELFLDVLEQYTGDTEDEGWLALVQ